MYNHLVQVFIKFFKFISSIFHNEIIFANGYKISGIANPEGTALPVLRSDSDTTVTIYLPKIN